MPVDFERNQRVVLGLHQQSGDADAIEKLIGRLRRVVVVGDAKAERGRGEQIVEFVDTPRAVQIVQPEQPGRQALFQTDSFLSRLRNRAE